MRQTTNHILMIRPANFGFNEETAESNAFQTNDTSKSIAEIKATAVAEFDQFVAKLEAEGVDVTVIQDSETPIKTDAVFPNNWISFHEDETIITYPMFAEIRRLERQESIIEEIMARFEVKKRIHLETSEAENLFLEGTGSMIFDRPNKIVYACLSPRTDDVILDRFCAVTGFKKIVFLSTDQNDKEIYHTNVMMAIGEDFSIICLDSIKNESERNTVIDALTASGKSIIEINMEQVLSFAGNMLEIRGAAGKRLLVMSQQSYDVLTDIQITEIKRFTTPFPISIPIIETYGGGSVRCMMAEVFLAPKGA